MALHCTQIWRLRTYFVEVALVFFCLAKHMSLPLFQEFVHDKLKISYEQKSLNNSGLSASDATDLRHNSVITILSLQVAESLPAIVIVVVLGAVSDRMAQRKIMLWLPSLGLSSYAFVYIMSAYTGWELDELFLAAALRGLSGNAPSFHAGATFFAVNDARAEYRVFRLGCQEILNSLMFALGNLIVGYWVESSGYIPAFWLVFACSTASLLISAFAVQESNAEQTPLSNDQCCHNIFGPLVQFLNCKNRTNLKIWLIIISFQLITFIQVGQENIYVPYLMQRPHSWSNSDIGLYLFLMMGLAAAGTLFGLYIMPSFFSDSTIVLIGYLSRAIGTLWFAVVQKGFLLYAASVFALMHSGLSATFFLAQLMFTAIYNASIELYTGLVFIAATLFIALPALSTILLKCFKDANDEERQFITDNTRSSASTECLTTSEPTPI